MFQVQFRQENTDVVLIVNGRRSITIGWKSALEVLRALDQQIRNVEAQAKNPLVLPLPETVVMVGKVGLAWRQEQGKILLIGAGRLLLDLPAERSEVGPSIARLFYQRWMQATKQAEEIGNADQIARDAALLHRTGAPIGLTSNPKIQAEAMKISDGDRELRRFVPDRRIGPVIGAPVIRQSNATPFERALQLVKHLPASQIATLRAAIN